MDAEGTFLRTAIPKKSLRLTIRDGFSGNVGELIGKHGGYIPTFLNLPDIGLLNVGVGSTEYWYRSTECSYRSTECWYNAEDFAQRYSENFTAILRITQLLHNFQKNTCDE